VTQQKLNRITLARPINKKAYNDKIVSFSK